ncbi:diguanylate cyclase [Methylobacterium sp. C25]|uniref:GGDEF domain-containing protein n=1 Tax=Methylobacterium sp. C25 TaxID=2721622 RepID=UPI001F330C3E|nr:diguanylate cyclase [Methylobacterium sp. C25]MCE4223066.1 diguanylate cyclase [Methylobacterium sp. C25]
MLPLIEEGLTRPWHRLRLPEPLEARWAAQGRAGNARRIRSWLLVFIIVNVISVKVDLDLFGAEAVAIPAALTLGLLVPVTLLAILLLRKEPSPARQLCAVLTVSLVAMAVTLNSARIVPGPHGDVYSILAAIVPLVVGMIAPLSFRHGIIYCACCFSLYVGSIAGFGLGDHDGYGVPMLVASLILVPLKLTYAQEWETKQSFLLGLRERIQATALAEANSRLVVLSETDPLTSVANRRLFDQRLDEAWAAAAREQQWLGLAVVDVDHFKAFNDAAGHAEGDRCLREIASALQEAMATRNGLVARFGGEEFVALLPGATPEAMLEAGQALHDAVAHLALPHPGRLGALVSASVGITASHGATGAFGVTSEGLLSAADQALYQAKHAGRDRVEAACAQLTRPTRIEARAA